MTRHTRLGKRLRALLTAVGLSAITLAGLHHQPTAGAPEDVLLPVASAAEKPLCVAYVYDRATLTLKDEDASKLDQLNFSFALIKNGKASGSHWQSIDTFKAYVRRHEHITPVLSIGGWGADGFSQAAATDAGREKLADSLVSLMDEHGFMGVDIDWEYPGTRAGGIQSSRADKENYTALLRLLRQKLDELRAQDGKKRLLCVALGVEPTLTDNIEAATVGSLADQVNLMTYDMHQGASQTAHHTALYSSSGKLCADSAIKAYAATGIPRRKMILGAAFYGRAWTKARGADLPTNGGVMKEYTFRRIASMVEDNTFTAYYDSEAEAAYLYDGSTFISYDNERSILAKGAYVRQNGLMGLMCWEYGGDSHSRLISAMAEGLQP